MFEKSLAVKVTKKNAEKTRKELIEKNKLRTDLKIIKNDKHVFLPVKKIKKDKFSYNFLEKKFEKQKNKTKSYQEIINIPEELKKFLPSSYDIIGSIALIKIPDELKKYSSQIGSSLLETNKNIKTVYDVKPVEGQFRTRKLDLIAGVKETLTLHKENNVEFFVDVKNTYFSPRLANERRRIADLVEKKEIIVDMFTGIAPFPIVIMKHSRPEKIFGIDKNKDAIVLAKKNIVHNKFSEKIKVFCDDAKNVENILEENQIKADRVIMNLPFSSIDFLDYALKIVKKTFVIHLYEFLDEKDIIKRVKEIKNNLQKKDINILNLKYNIIKSYSPTEFYICFDITGKKNS
jgi:tRNA (guanine37-N1)-methyltransferase